MRRFEGKVALIIGGGRGMGLAVAEAFAAEGATVVVTSRDSACREDALSAIEARGGRAIFVSCDPRERGSIASMVEKTVREAGTIDIAVLTAAAYNGGYVENYTEENFEDIVRANVCAPFWLAKDVIPHLSKAKDAGRLIYISSGSGNRQCLPGQVPYGASKAYLNAFVRGLATEVGSRNVLVTAVEPGLIASDRMKAGMGLEVADAIAAKFPVARVGQPEDIANSILFLASKEASYITGTTLLVDGGATIVPLSL